MDYHALTSGLTQPFWLKARNQTYPALQENLQVEVCVIGAGMAGLTLAYQLQKQGYQVVLLEDGRIGSGETGRTSGHLTFALDDRFTQLIKVHGLEKAQLTAESHIKAIDLIEEIIHEAIIDCDFERLPGYLFSNPSLETDELWEELEAAQSAGLSDLGIVLDNPEGTQNFGPALVFSQQAQFHPMAYLEGVARAFVKLGGQIFEQTRAQSLENLDDNRVEIACSRNHQIVAQHCVLTTNAPTLGQNLLDLKMEATRSYIAVAELPQGSLRKALYWDRFDPYHYARIQKGQDFDYLILGGEDHRTGHLEELDQHFEKLEAWGREHFPAMGEIINSWSGQILEPIDYLAFIGKRHPDENIYLYTGDSGHGLTHAAIAAMLIPDLIAGRDNPWAELYAPNRTALKPLGDFVSNALDSASHYLDHLTTWTTDVERLKPEHGNIIQDGLKKVACYKAEDGTLHAFDAVCPHKKGLLKWNALEKSWDCPVHGSRFSCQGHLINGPANQDLIPVEIEVAETVT